MKKKNEVWVNHRGKKWSEKDFDEMSWHDCTIHSLGMDQDGEWQNDLVLDIDFIVKWTLFPDKTFSFRIAPAILRFHWAEDIRINIHLQPKFAMEIGSVEQTVLERTVLNDGRELVKYHWSIKSDVCSIDLDGSGFSQELTAEPVEQQTQSLKLAQRTEMKRKYRSEGAKDGAKTCSGAKK